MTTPHIDPLPATRLQAFWNAAADRATRFIPHSLLALARCNGGHL